MIDDRLIDIEIGDRQKERTLDIEAIDLTRVTHTSQISCVIIYLIVYTLSHLILTIILWNKYQVFIAAVALDINTLSWDYFL